MSASGKHDFLPAREADLLTWSANFDAKLNTPPGPGAYGILPAQAAHYASLHAAFASAYAASVDPSTNSKAAIAAKTQAKKALKAEARALVRIAQAFPGMTDALRGALGLTVPDQHLTPAPPPVEPPVVSIVSGGGSGRTVRIRLRDKTAPDRLGRPPGVGGAVVMSYTALPGGGETEPPANPARWSFRGIATRRFFDVRFDADVPPGAQSWITAAWFSTRGELGRAATAQSFRAGDGLATLRLAA